jgi:DNA-binding CsgD family transcriptional regulator
MAGSDQDSFLDLLYGASAQPELWPTVMERFADIVGGTGVILSRLDVGNGGGSRLTSRLDPEMSTRYFQYYASRNPLTNVSDRRAYASNWRKTILTDEDWIAKEDLVRTEYYNDMMQPQGVHSVLFVRLALYNYETCVLNVCRPKSRGQFDGRDVEAAARLHPHLIRAFDLGQKLAIEGGWTDAAGAVFELSDKALFLLDKSARVVRLNRAAEALVGSGRGLSVIGRRLTADHTPTQRRLEALVALAASPDAERRAGGSMALKSFDHALPLSLTTAPLRAQSAPVFYGEPCVLVCVTDPEGGTRIHEETLREAFGFTPAETRLAIALLEGGSQQDVAASLGISVNTVHVHVARIFQKTGVNRQSALLRLLMRVTGAGLP